MAPVRVMPPSGKMQTRYPSSSAFWHSRMKPALRTGESLSLMSTTPKMRKIGENQCHRR